MVPPLMNASIQANGTPLEVEIVQLYRDLHARAFALTRDPDAAADLVQQACERGLRMKSTISDGTNTSAWLKCVIRNLFVDQHRLRQRYAPLQSDLEAEAEANEGCPPVFADLLSIDDVKQEIHGMREADRMILVLALLEGRSYRDIANRLGILPKTVSTRLFRAKAKLRKQMQALYYERLATFRPS